MRLNFRNLLNILYLVSIVIFVIFYWSIFKFFDAGEVTIVLAITILSFLHEFFKKRILETCINHFEVVPVSHKKHKAEIVILILLFIGFIVFWFVEILYSASVAETLRELFVASFPIFFVFFSLNFKQANFYIDNQGIIQPELFKKNIPWSDIHSFRIEEDEVIFTWDDKQHENQIKEQYLERLNQILMNQNLKT